MAKRKHKKKKPVKFPGVPISVLAGAFGVVLLIAAAGAIGEADLEVNPILAIIIVPIAAFLLWAVWPKNKD